MIKRIVLVVCFCIGYYPFAFSQDSIPAVQDLLEEKNLKFQESFFKALSNKATENYKKAIENLEMCNQILPSNTVVYFEFSKNYFLLNKNQLAKQYINKALEKEPDNTWMNLHLVKILSKERDFKAAIEVQKKLLETHVKRKEELATLYLKDRNYKQAILLMEQIEKENGLSRNLTRLKESIKTRKTNLFKENKTNEQEDFITQFNENNSLQNLLKILKKSEKEDPNAFNKLTKQGLELYPAQAILYLYRARAFNYQKKYNQAINILQIGIDFVIDDDKMSREMYKEIAKSYKGLGNNDKYQEFINKGKQIEE